MIRTDIRIALPSKGALAEDSLVLLSEAGLKVRRPNPRQYQATIPALPGVTVIFQRPGDIVVGVRQGSIDFGITGHDIVAEKGSVNGDQPILLLHDALDYGHCTLNLAIPEDSPVRTMADLQEWAEELAGNGRTLRIATKFPHATAQFLAQHAIQPVKLIDAEGTLEIAPAIGYADLIADLVSSGITLRDNHLRPLDDGQILRLPGRAHRPSRRPANQARSARRRPHTVGIHRSPPARPGFLPGHRQRARQLRANYCAADGQPPHHLGLTRPYHRPRHVPARLPRTVVFRQHRRAQRQAW